MAPFDLLGNLGTFWTYAVYLLIGAAFGAVLESAGFAKSTKLAAQFYFKDLTVLKVMFTAIVTAMVLLYLSSGLGWMDFDDVWVNPTYWWPGIVGGLIMGVGFIIGGFCPGTSLVAAATLKVDGVFFVLGAITGILAFGETVGLFEGFWNSSFAGRLTLFDWLHTSAGIVVIAVVLMALGMFWGGEWLEERFGGIPRADAPRGRYVGAGILVVLAVAVFFIGQPTNDDRWDRIAGEMETVLADREVQIHPGELLDLIHDNAIKVVILDCRDEGDFNLFHIWDARRVDCHDAIDVSATLHNEPDNTVIVTVSNDEGRATRLWKVLVADSVRNVYILEGGINHWIAVFDPEAVPAAGGDDELRYAFSAALGSSWPAADPDPEEFELEYTEKVVIEVAQAPAGGGCG
ncbi:MAG: YeeE/YedE family protein [Actinobacteria bacterium]|nr:YeeE/YedE family protein [Actinomycetota bacterium]